MAVDAERFYEYLMGEALVEAAKAAELGEVPVGAVLARSGAIIARAHNLMETNEVASAHAESLVIERGSGGAAKWRLDGAVLAVTLEPCTMCAGLIKLARVSEVVFGASDSRGGAVGSLYNLLTDTRTGPAPLITGGIFAEKSQELLRSFFRARRAKQGQPKGQSNS